eukprot:scaffold2909_cov78-Cylindrotheca_fusiformis.AAC.11
MSIPSPAATIDSILQKSRRGAGIDMDSKSIVGHFISTYMSGCDSRNPADMMLPLKKHCAALCRSVFRKLGKGYTITGCSLFGNGSSSVSFDNTLPLWKVAKSRNGITFMDSIYRDLQKFSICTGLFWMIIIAIPGMILITLRDAWRYHV